jgi:hypothetical protein
MTSPRVSLGAPARASTRSRLSVSCVSVGGLDRPSHYCQVLRITNTGMEIATWLVSIVAAAMTRSRSISLTNTKLRHIREEQSSRIWARKAREGKCHVTITFLASVLRRTWQAWIRKYERPRMEVPTTEGVQSRTAAYSRQALYPNPTAQPSEPCTARKSGILVGVSGTKFCLV